MKQLWWVPLGLLIVVAFAWWASSLGTGSVPLGTGPVGTGSGASKPLGPDLVLKANPDEVRSGGAGAAPAFESGERDSLGSQDEGAREAVLADIEVTVSGRLLDSGGNPLVQRAFRVLQGEGYLRSKTDGEGRFDALKVMVGAEPLTFVGTWSVEHGVNAFRGEASVALLSDAPIELGDVTMEPRYSAIEGRVVTTGGKGVHGAEVSGGGATVRSGPQGHFILTAPRQAYSTRARHPAIGKSDLCSVESGEQGVSLVLGLRRNPLVQLYAREPQLLEHVEFQATEVSSGRTLNLDRGGLDHRGKWFLSSVRSELIELRLLHMLGGVELWSTELAVQWATAGEGIVAGDQPLELVLEDLCPLATVFLTSEREAQVSFVADSRMSPLDPRKAEAWRLLKVRDEPWTTPVPATGTLEVRFRPQGLTSWSEVPASLHPGVQQVPLIEPLEIQISLDSDPRLSGEAERGGPWLLALEDRSVMGRRFSYRTTSFPTDGLTDSEGALVLDHRVSVLLPRAGSYALLLQPLGGLDENLAVANLYSDRESAFEEVYNNLQLNTYSATVEVDGSPEQWIHVSDWTRVER